MKRKKTGFCWDCGYLCKDLFCNEKCEKAYNRKEEQINRIMKSKRDAYGAKGI